MRKFKIRAAVIGKFGCEYCNEYYPDDYTEEIIFADTEDEAEIKFIDYMRENLAEGLEIDDITIQDLGAPILYLTVRNESYRAVDCARKTLKVSELMDILAEYDEDAPVVLANNSGIFPVYSKVKGDYFEEETPEDY